jgi:HD-like signal output (HDOD) protein
MSPIVIILLVLIATLAAWLMWQLRTPAADAEQAASSADSRPNKSSDEPEPQTAPVPYTDQAIEGVFSDGYRLAFGAADVDEEITSEHEDVLARIEASIDTAIHQPEYFPRRPMLLPKLLRAINDSDSTRQELVSLILEDPSLAGNVLRRANSALYRISPAPVDRIDRAVVNLGMDGLRALVGTAILQPVFRLRTGLFDEFATLTWEQAQRASIAAETYAKKTRSGDPFVAQLLGVLRPLAHIVLFKLTLERYRETPNLPPRAAVFIRVMQEHSRRVAHLIAITWELPDPSLKALDEQQQRASPHAMSPLGRSTYFGDLCGSLATLAMHDRNSQESARALLMAQGLDRETASALWRAATSAETDL